MSQPAGTPTPAAKDKTGIMAKPDAKPTGLDAASTPTLFAWAVRHRSESTEVILNHTSRGRAVYEALRDWQGVWPSLKFTDLRVRKVGAPVTSPRLLRVATYRGLPHVRAGDRVKVRGLKSGFIVDGNDSANFDVLMDEGYVVNCHPCDLLLDR